MKKQHIYALLLVLCMIFNISAVATAEGNDAGVSTSITQFRYVITDKDGNIKESGIIDSRYRYSWPALYLDNGDLAIFMPTDTDMGFYVIPDTIMTLKYTTSVYDAKTEYMFVKNKNNFYSVFKTGVSRARETSVTATSDERAYYYAQVRNVSSDKIEISNISFVF